MSSVFVAMLALAYFTSRSADMNPAFRRSISLIGALVLLPACLAIAASRSPYPQIRVDGATRVAAWLVAVGLPLAFAGYHRRRGVVFNAIGAAWLIGLATFTNASWTGQLTSYAWCAIGSVGMVAWGIYEQEKPYINMGVVGFAFTVLSFYFSSVMAALDRSIALMAGGVLFLIGGYLLERVRRNLVARVQGAGGRP
jgi:hypothetical protein